MAEHGCDIGTANFNENAQSQYDGLVREFRIALVRTRN